MAEEEILVIPSREKKEEEVEDFMTCDGNEKRGRAHLIIVFLLLSEPGPLPLPPNPLGTTPYIYEGMSSDKWNRRRKK